MPRTRDHILEVRCSTTACISLLQIEGLPRNQFKIAVPCLAAAVATEPLKIAAMVTS